MTPPCRGRAIPPPRRFSVVGDPQGLYFSFRSPSESGHNTPRPNREAPGGDPPNLLATEESRMAKAKKVAFGGYAINFKGCSDSLEDIMGSKPIGPSEMTKRIWAYVKKKKLAKK